MLGNGAFFEVAWRFAFFGGAGCSGAMIEPLSDASGGAASTTLGGSAAAGEEDVAEVDAVAVDSVAVDSVAVDPVVGADAVTAAPELTALAGGAEAVAGATAFGNTVAAAGDETGVGAATLTAGVIAGRVCDSVREDTVELGGLSLDGAAATEAGAAVVAGATGATDGTAAARTLVTMARAATGVLSGSLGRSSRESTTPAPAVAPIAVATKTTRAVRAKLGAGAK